MRWGPWQATHRVVNIVRPLWRELAVAPWLIPAAFTAGLISGTVTVWHPQTNAIHRSAKPEQMERLIGN